MDGRTAASDELAQRYKTTAELAFYRAWSALRGFGKDIVRKDKQMAAMQLKIDKLEMQQAAQKKAEQESAPRSRGAAAKSRRATKGKVASLEWVSSRNRAILEARAA